MNKVGWLGEGRIEIKFEKPFSEDRLPLEWLFILGWRKGNGIMVLDGKVVGVRCHIDDWVDVMKNSMVSNKVIDQFYKVCKELRKELK